MQSSSQQTIYNICNNLYINIYFVVYQIVNNVLLERESVWIVKFIMVWYAIQQHTYNIYKQMFAYLCI